MEVHIHVTKSGQEELRRIFQPNTVLIPKQCFKCPMRSRCYPKIFQRIVAQNR